MAKLSVNYFSRALKRDVELTVLLPSDTIDFERFEYCDKKPYRTLYLLHGMLGNRHDWIDKTLLMNYCERSNIAVVMPSGENSMYVTNAINHTAYSTWIGEELVLMTRNMFALSDKREDTYLAGLSMGGFGSLINGLKFADTFSVIGSFSAPIVGPEKLKQQYTGENVFGISFKAQFEADPDLFDIYKILDRGVKHLPYLFLSCGSNDYLVDGNRDFVKYLESKQAAYQYFELDDDHSWTFWDASIKRFISFLNPEV